MFQNRGIKFFFYSVINIKSYKSFAQLCHQELAEQMQRFFILLCFTWLLFSATRFVRDGEKYYVYFIDNSLLFSIVKNFQNRLTADNVITKIRHHVIFREYVQVVVILYTYT